MILMTNYKQDLKALRVRKSQKDIIVLRDNKMNKVFRKKQSIKETKKKQRKSKNNRKNFLGQFLESSSNTQ
jgi:hypothetical protein